MVRRRLVPGGRLYLFSQAPGWRSPKQAKEFGGELSGVLNAAGFAPERVLAEEVGTAIAAGVVARAPA